MTCDDLLSRMSVKLRQVNYTNLNVDMNKFVNVDTNTYLLNQAIKKTMETQLWKNSIICPDSNIIMTIPTQNKSKPHTKFVVTDLKKIPERFAWSINYKLQQIAETEFYRLCTKYMFPVSTKITNITIINYKKYMISNEIIKNYEVTTIQNTEKSYTKVCRISWELISLNIASNYF